MGYYIKSCYLQKLNNNESIGLRGSSSVEYSTQAERTEMALKYCQSHKCHTYDTKDRKRGSKDNRVNQTRRRSDFYYGGGNFCSLNCYNDWAEDFMNRAIDSVSGRITEPYKLTIENAWRKTRRHNWNGVSGYSMTYFWTNMITGNSVEITKEEYETQTQPNL